MLGTRDEEKKKRGTGPRPREIRYEVRDARSEGKIGTRDEGRGTRKGRSGTETEENTTYRLLPTAFCLPYSAYRIPPTQKPAPEGPNIIDRAVPFANRQLRRSVITVDERPGV